MHKMKIAVLFGGVSSEHEVSLSSAYNVITNLEKSKFEIIPIGITKNGHWLYYPGPYEKILTGEWQNDMDCCPAVISPDRTHGGILKIMENFEYALLKIDCVFPMFHGRNGEDGTIQGLLELAGIPYVGCNLLSSATCMDKVTTHILLEAAGIKCADWCSVTKENIKDLDYKCEEISQKLLFPIFTKPANTGSSVGISKCCDKKSLRQGMITAFTHDDKIICESEIIGKEVECALLGNSNAKASILGQIVPSGDFYDYDSKYENESKLIIPADLDEQTTLKVKQIAIKAYKVMGCSGFARIDFFVTQNKEIYLNEINTIPGFTNISMYPMLWNKGGLPYEQLLEKLIELATDKN